MYLEILPSVGGGRSEGVNEGKMASVNKYLWPCFYESTNNLRYRRGVGVKITALRPFWQMEVYL